LICSQSNIITWAIVMLAWSGFCRRCLGSVLERRPQRHPQRPGRKPKQRLQQANAALIVAQEESGGMQTKAERSG